ncbi:MAG: polyphosphate polymerase domain-containing protein [Flavobacteriales bacterium]|nr:polyphosphate polymerase domain-containing protein [Flavobacteriales bacterium]
MAEILSTYTQVSLNDMDAVALMNRVDTKFLAPKSAVWSVLKELSASYQVMQIDDQRIFQYRTVYFDTEEQDFLYQHLRGKPNRLKVRARQYVGSDTQFFEIKKKTNKGNTIKSRIPSGRQLNIIGERQAHFLTENTSIASGELKAHIEVDFHRITLVGLEHNERITFDLQLSFRSDQGVSETDEFVIIEHKRSAHVHGRTPALVALKRERIYASSLSKYCLGMILTNKTDRYNNYKPKLRKLNKISADGNIW